MSDRRVSFVRKEGGSWLGALARISKSLPSLILALLPLVNSFLSHCLIFYFHLGNMLALFCNGQSILKEERLVHVKPGDVSRLNLVRC